MFEIYTDGGCAGNGTAQSVGGYGLAVIKEERLVYSEHESFRSTTNNQMELFAIQRGLDWLIENRIEEPTTLFSDSQYCVDGCNSWVHNWAKRNWTRKKNRQIKNLDQWQDLYLKIQKLPNLQFKWVKGHAGNKWNEFCDELAQRTNGSSRTFEFHLPTKPDGLWLKVSPMGCLFTTR